MNNWLKCEKGSLLLETAMILPIFLMFIFLLWTLIRISVIQMALDKSTSDLVQSVNSSAYGISIVIDKGNELKQELKTKANGGIDQWIGKQPDEAAKMLNISGIDTYVKELVGNGIDGGLPVDAIGSSYYEKIVGKEGPWSNSKLKDVFKSNIRMKDNGEISGYYGSGDIKIEEVNPVQATGKEQLYKVRVSYVVPLNLPFLNGYKVNLQSVAGGYLWTTNR
ncbi:TadE/TadG family type IV pilus assembly protein [Carnobacterium gallinarum]|uniref:TadE/TadG family type IV pilus assembly protein n=1 Tax=Carnobacterium gallinarum TaxID=2749 RepID=UPI00054EDE74|nr:TadE family protein [Carnobacterium gallinarum]